MSELILVLLDGVSYGIWRESLLALDVVKTSHRLSIDRASIATLSVVGDHTETLADLAVCMGHAPASTESGAHVLRSASGAGVSGFIVGGDITTIQADPDDCLPMPGFLRTPVIDRCAVHGSLPIPIINISALYARVLQGGPSAASTGSAAPSAQGVDASEAPFFRIFTVGGSAYATACAETKLKPFTPGPLARLPLLPPWVKGITLSGGRVLPVIDLARRLVGNAARENCPAVVTAIGPESFALLVDEDRGLWDRGQTEVRALPPIVRTPWMRAAALNAGRIALIIDLGGLLSMRGDSLRESPRPDSAGSRFAPPVNRMDLDVVEFSLSGATHALPKSEMEGIVPLGPLHQIAPSPKIVAGVVDHDGELLPVIDLAPVFGKRFRADPGSPLLLVKKGTFRVLVMIEKVIGERRLAREVQRAVPISLPYPAVYGCYVDENSVRLILNLEAITENFDSSFAGRLSPALSPIFAQGTGQEKRPLPEMSAQPPELKILHDPRAGAFQEAAVQPVDAPFPVDTPSPVEGIPEAAAHESTDAPRSPEDLRVGEQAGTVGETVTTGQTASCQASGPTEISLEGEESREPSLGVGDSAEDDGRRARPEPAAAAAVVIPARRSRRRRLVTVAIAGLLIVGLAAALLFSGIVGKVLSPANPPRASTPASAAQVAEPPAAVTGPVEEPPPPAAKPGQQLEIVVPAENGANGANGAEYVVVQGDTLWRISERLTGNPFNYPRIAGENRIADPDLIFPGQRIRIVRK